MRPPVVVVGVGRSGTSLLQSMLHAHPEISFLPETHFFRTYVGPPLRRWAWRLRGPAALCRALERDRDVARSGIAPQRLVAPFRAGQRSFSTPAVYRRLLRLHAGDCDGDPVVGDKDPRLLDFLPALDRFVPGVRVVHIVRDPRDVLLSRRGATWSAGRRDLSHAAVYRAQLRRARRTGPPRIGDRYLEIRYEELLRSPEEELVRVCQHLDLSYSGRMLSFGEAARELVAGDEEAWKSETLGPLLRDNFGKWRGELAPETVRLVERICLVPFPDLPYRLEAPPPATTARRAALAAAGLGASVASRLYPLRTTVA